MSQAIRILGCNPLTAYHVCSCTSASSNSVLKQIFRSWKRKPIWLPTAKTKMFKVPPRPVIPTEETVEIKRLFNQYRTVVKSIRKHMMKLAEENKILEDPFVVEKAKEDDFNACSAINDEWNKKIHIEREQYLAKAREIRKAKILQAVEYRELKMQEQKKRATEEIKKAMEELPTFITSDSIDQAIEEALNNIVNYNFAIDVDGNKYFDDKESQDQVSNQRSFRLFSN